MFSPRSHLVSEQRENEILRRRLSEFEMRQGPANSSLSSHGEKIASASPTEQHEDGVADLDDVGSNVSSRSTLSVSAQEATIAFEQPKYFDRKRRLLAAEPHSVCAETEVSISRKTSPQKKTCLDDIVDSLNQKAQAEQEGEDDDDDHGAEARKQRETNVEEDFAIDTIENVRPLSARANDDDDDEEIDIEDGIMNDDQR